MRAALIWAALSLVLLVAVGLAATSPLLAWRQPIYIAAGLAGVLGLAVMLFQPLLAAGGLPGIAASAGRRAHRWVGGLLVALVLLHVVGLWITSPPDLIDALLFRSPAPFSAWGVIAMWAIFAAATLAIFRRRLDLRTWRVVHTTLAAVIVVSTAVHAVLIEGTMEQISKVVLCLAVLGAAGWAIVQRKVWVRGSRQG